jgi:hypothetical protein
VIQHVFLLQSRWRQGPYRKPLLRLSAAELTACIFWSGAAANVRARKALHRILQPVVLLLLQVSNTVALQRAASCFFIAGGGVHVPMSHSGIC